MSQFVFVFASLLVLVHGYKTRPGQLSNGRIVGGTTITIEERPYQVSLQEYVLVPTLVHFCGGSIINDRTVVTAAHCLYWVPSNRLYIVAGKTNVESQTIQSALRTVTCVYHRDYDEKTLDNDIGIVILENPLTFSAKIQPIKIATTEPAADDRAVISGWGAAISGGSVNPVLKEAVVPIVDRQSCSNSYQSIIPVTQNMICAGIGGNDTCQGDSGGPLVVNGRLSGITSFGVDCASPSYPGVYTLVKNYQQWINNMISSHT